MTASQRTGSSLGFGTRSVLIVAFTGVAVAGVVLVPQHTVEDNVLRGRGLFADLFAAGTIGFSIVEAAGATT
jgi:hypothetical protein